MAAGKLPGKKEKPLLLQEFVPLFIVFRPAIMLALLPSVFDTTTVFWGYHLFALLENGSFDNQATDHPLFFMARYRAVKRIDAFRTSP